MGQCRSRACELVAPRRWGGHPPAVSACQGVGRKNRQNEATCDEHHHDRPRHGQVSFRGPRGGRHRVVCDPTQAA